MSFLCGPANPSFKGNAVGYGGLHAWVRAHLPKQKSCNSCLKNKKLEVSNVSGKYLHDLSDWEWICRKCHMTKDGRLAKQCSKGRMVSENTKLKLSQSHIGHIPWNKGMKMPQHPFNCQCAFHRDHHGINHPRWGRRTI